MKPRTSPQRIGNACLARSFLSGVFNALSGAPRTALGPDGIPFRAWRNLGEFAARALYDAFLATVGADGLSLLETDWDDFNKSSMAFLPTKPSGPTPDGMEFY